MDELTGRARSRSRWPAIGIAVAVIGAIAFVMARGPANVGTAKEIQRDVEVQSAGAAFQSVHDHPNVKKGDVVRTSKDGLGEIEYGDGSITRLDGDTVFKVDELLTQGKRVVRASLSNGRVWNKVESLTESEDRFEVRTPNAVASVRGTTFFCEAEPVGPLELTLFQTTCVQIEGQTQVVWDNGAEVELGPGGCSTEGGPCKWTPAQLIAMLSKFAALDGIKLPWKASEKATEATEEVPQVEAPGRAVAGVAKQLQPEREPRKRQPSVENHDDDEDSDDRDDDDDRFDEPRQFTSDSGGGGGVSDGGGDSGSGGSGGGCDGDSNHGHGNSGGNDCDNPGNN